jgi:ABC-type Mn2+/Zn2+ transport system permease subunit
MLAFPGMVGSFAGWFVDPYRSGFMQRALLAVLLIGSFVPAVGVWIVLRRLSYLGDAMSHALLAGVAGAYLLGISVIIGALFGGIAMALVIAALSRIPGIREDASIGVAETVLFALGLVLIGHQSGKFSVDLTHFLFGQIATTSRGDLLLSAALAVAGVAFMTARFHDLRASTFDATHARLTGLSVDMLTYGLLLLLAIAVVVSLQTVGLLMSVAMLVTPATTARLLTNRLPRTIVLSSTFGVASGVVGLTLSYHFATPPGATIALTAALWLVLVLSLRAIVRQARSTRPRSGPVHRGSQ